MKKIFAITLSLVLGFTMWAQNDLKEIIGRLDSYRVKAEFTCKLDSDELRMDCKGTALAQGNCFVVKANGFEIYCDGSKLIIMDPAEKEAYIQDAEGLGSYLMENMSAVSELKFQELRYLDKSKDLSAFSFDTGKLGKDWTVTDLR